MIESACRRLGLYRVGLLGAGLLLAAAQSLWAQDPPTDHTAPTVGAVQAGDGVPSADPGSWPQFRGPNRDAIAADAKGLYRSWPAEGPKVLWTVEGLAPGYSGAAVHGGKVYLHDYDQAERRWMIRCLSLGDGKEVWRWSYPRLIRANHGITRTVPVVDDRYVVSLDPQCVLHGFDAATGKRLWARNLVAEFGTRIPPWYNGQCPLNEPDRVIVGVGGKEVLMAAFDKATGKTLWETPNTGNFQMSHASVMPMTLLGFRQYVWCTMRGLVGVAEDGRFLWQGPGDAEGRLAWTPNTAVAPSAVAIGADGVFMTSSYRAGSIMTRVALAGGFMVNQLSYKLDWDRFASDCHTPIIHKDRLFAVNDDKFTCLNPADGSIVWSSPDGIKFGLGNFILADGMFFILEGDSGRLRLIEASVEGWKELASAQVLGGHDVWAPMALVNGKLLLRDMEKLICIQVGPPAE